ncbi:MAG: hypothetical protein HYY62_02195 [Deltaproteobacteria bacterium]|nr:hypothetical protein [Deltaproteobacteria bacterium]
MAITHSTLLYASEEIATPDDLRSTVVIVEPNQSKATVRVRTRSNSGNHKYYLIRFIGQDHESRALKVAQAIKNCAQLNITYNQNNRVRSGSVDAFVADSYTVYVFMK